ncbi:iron ABC transporter permease [Roseococcus sp. SDR]|uniref:FecCD family ABC transporter permease n=1 Tax=Roseococcus sp. SDR TaxID=2835532 RepID=UPI001BCE0BB7|nr:iron ABC transporter permease [Roseococcus sp. SDR]MBS7792340.1 iron ABC transporter permease [Roseococcus sp. SDR]MBV1847654.1 iron ABC transporter permease [Roseococcus sp. SDR]
MTGRAPWPMLAGLLLLTAVAHLTTGPVAIPLAELPDHVIVHAVRLPRLIVVLLAGAMLGLAGALLQTVTRNPLAEPGLMGVSAGAVLAIVLAIIAASRIEGLGMVRDTGWHLGLAGVAGGMLAGALTYALSRRHGVSRPVLLVLMGVLVAGSASAVTSMLLLTADDNQLRLVLHWTIGSTNGRGWVHVEMLAPYAAAGLSMGLLSAGIANALQLGDGVAACLGLRVEPARLMLIFAAAVLTAGAVSVVGGIGFVGLIGPHLARMLVGNDARRLFPAAALVAALLLTLADLGARSLPLGWIEAWSRSPVTAPSGIPVGVVTPLLGVPFFLWLVFAHRPRA